MYKKFPEVVQSLFSGIPANKRIYAAFLLVLLLAYFPLWSFIMSLKNDALTLSYPMFRFFSQQIHAGSIPWWHYNVNMGFPLHADPGFPFWSPVTWFWAGIGSSLYVYSFLVLSYVLIAGTGMIKLTRYLGLLPLSQLTVSAAFILSGFFVAHLQHPHYLFEAAFIPFIFLYFLRIIYQPSLKSSIYLSISIFFLLNSGYPSFSISACYFILVLLIGLLVIDSRLRSYTNCKKIAFYFSISLLAGILLSLPYLYSLYELYPLFNRAAPLASRFVLSGGMTVFSLFSLLFPLSSAVQSAFYGTDIAWNNIYLGLLPLIFFVYAVFFVRHPMKVPFLLAGICMLLLSFQGTVKGLSYKWIPLSNLVHSNGGFRIYFILSALLLAGYGIDAFLKQSSLRQAKKVAYLLLCMVIVTGLIAAFYTTPGPYTDIVSKIKNLSISQALIVQSILAAIALLFIILYWKYKRTVIALGIGEMIIAFLINIPFTGLGIHNTHTVEEHIDSITTSAKALSFHSSLKDIRSWMEWDRFLNEPLFYAQTIGKTKAYAYPSSLSSYESFIGRHGFEAIESKKVVTTAAELANQDMHIQLEHFEAHGDRVLLTMLSPKTVDTLIIAQNDYPNWKYYLNGKMTAHFPVLGTLTGIPIGKGEMTVAGFYRPHKVVACFWISILAWTSIFVFLFRKKTMHVYRDN